MFYWIQNSDDGVRIDGPLKQAEVLARIAEETSEDYVPEARAEFQETIPDAYTDTNMVCIIRGEVVIPEPVQRVTEWTL